MTGDYWWGVLQAAACALMVGLYAKTRAPAFAGSAAFLGLLALCAWITGHAA